MHRTPLLLLLALICGLPLAPVQAQSEEDMAQIRDMILDEYERRFDEKVEQLRGEMRAELGKVLEMAAARMQAMRGGNDQPPRAVEPREIEPAPVRPSSASARPFLGIKTRELKSGLRSMLGLEEGVGVVVDAVREGSPAAKGGLARNDVIVSIGKKNIGSEQDVRDYVSKGKVGDKLTFGILRRGVSSNVVVTLAARPTAGANESAEAPAKEGDDIDELLDDLLDDEGAKNGESEKREDPEAPNSRMLEGLRDQLPEQYRQMLDTPEGREMLEQQLESFNQMLETPEGRDMMLMQIEQMLDRFAEQEGMSDEDFDRTMEMIEGFLTRNSGERMRIIEGFMQMMQNNENPFEGLERLLGEEEEAEKPGFLGVTPDRNLTDAMRKDRGIESGGVLISAVHPGGPAEKAGIKAGDIITRFAGKSVEGLESLGQTIRGMTAGTEIEIKVVGENGKPRSVKVELGVRPER